MSKKYRCANYKLITKRFELSFFHKRIPRKLKKMIKTKMGLSWKEAYTTTFLSCVRRYKERFRWYKDWHLTEDEIITQEKLHGNINN